MKTTEINESLVGRRVKGVFTGMEVTGTITGIVENYSKSHPKQVANGSPEYQVCSKGVTIQLDNPVRWGDDFYTCYESTSRVSDEFGNLKYTELIDKECSINESLDKAIKYVKANKSWSQEDEDAAFEKILEEQCSLCEANSDIHYDISNLMEKWSEENNMDPFWWNEFTDTYEIFVNI